MDIRFYTASSPYLDHRSSVPSVDRTKAAAEKNSGDYDKATFHPVSAPSDDSSFAGLLTRTVSARLSKGADPKHVAGISQQVKAGTYQPDSRRIAERILGYR